MKNTKQKSAPFTPEEHEARAMLLGMKYHHGNGDPIYYREAKDGTMELTSLVDAITMEPLIPDTAIDWVLDQATSRHKRNVSTRRYQYAKTSKRP